MLILQWYIIAVVYFIGIATAIINIFPVNLVIMYIDSSKTNKIRKIYIC